MTVKLEGALLSQERVKQTNQGLQSYKRYGQLHPDDDLYRTGETSKVNLTYFITPLLNVISNEI